MGSRGSYGRSSSSASSNLVESVIPKKQRISYYEFKNDFSGALDTKGSYDKETKTIEILITPATKDIMEILPKSVLKEYEQIGYSKYQAAVDIKEQYKDAIISGGKLRNDLQEWEKKVYKWAKKEVKVERKYGGDLRWIGMSRPDKQKKIK